MNKTAILIFLAIFDTLLILFHKQDPVLNIPCSDIQFRATFPVLSYIRVLPRPNTTVPAGNHLITLNFIPDDNLNVIEQQSTVIYDIAENFDSNPISLPFLRSTRFNVTCSSDVDNLLITLYKSSFLGCNAIILLLLSATAFFTIIIIIAKEIFYERKKRQHLIPILLSVIFFIVLHIIAASIISKGLRIRDFPAQAKFIFSTPFISFQALQSYISKNIINKIISFVSPLRLESVNILLAQQPQSPESNKRIDTISPFLLTLTIISIIVSSLIFIVGLPYRQVIYSLLSVCFTIISSVMCFCYNSLQ
ncbi:MAG: hypothetical protein EZS28_044275 [Streblomastix strix]|uniref:Uncharacterized protein n=1 Tax=Streblomastix strix TaxID=222440 RepID=A0A5J4TPI4_9EUKA|nr:MAG: hypothetical protein EZS28_044275 [Streblomastix strix]